MANDFRPYLDPMQTRNQNDPPIIQNPLIQSPLMLARAYVLDQPYTGLFALEMALKVGTVFPNMYEAFPKII